MSFLSAVEYKKEKKRKSPHLSALGGFTGNALWVGEEKKSTLLRA